MRSLLRASFALAVASAGCSHTEYDLLEKEGASVGSGGDAGGADTTGGSTSDGSGGQPEPLDCTSMRDPTLVAVRIQSSGGLCLTQGAAITLGTSPGYEVVLQPCNHTSAQRWTVEVGTDDLREIRSEAVDMNLDVKFADTVDGTEFVLYTPHSLYNQRFVMLPEADGSFRLAPRHTSAKCGEAVGDATTGYGVELWPCDATEDAQLFSLIDCLDP